MHFRENIHRKTEIGKYISNGLVIKKRKDYRDNEILETGKDCSGVAPSYGDRFIPRRYALKRNERNTKFYGGKQDIITDILKWDIPNNYWLQNHFKDALNKCFDIKEDRVLKLTDPAVQFSVKNDKIFYPSSFHRKKARIGNGNDWSCIPRKKPIACLEATHESVGLRNCFDRNKMDWSVNGQVAASYEDEVIIWKHIRDMSVTFSVENINCLAYCPKGKYLALGFEINYQTAIELWDVNKYRIQIEVVQQAFMNASISIKCFEWSKCGKFLICGTNEGILYVLSVPTLKRVRKIQAHQHPISTIRFSPTMRYLASADATGTIAICDWFSMNVYLYVHCRRQSMVTFDWHPWNGVELAIAEQMPASILLLHVPSKQITASYKRNDKSVQIHSLTFNKITAELLLSVSRENSHGVMELKVLVLASLDRLVDVLTVEDDERFLMWNPDGTKVITAGTDDSLSIWSLYTKKEERHKEINEQSLLCTLLKRKIKCNCDYGTQFKLWSTIR